MVTRDKIIKVLKTVPDPELNISVWDLGLIYEIKINSKGVVDIEMTLTSIGCPLFSLISEPIKEKLMKLKGVTKVNINLTFEPPWSTDKMSESAKLQLGIE